MKIAILSALAVLVCAAPIAASAEDGRREHRENRREWRQDGREHRREWRDDRRNYRQGYRDGRHQGYYNNRYYAQPRSYYYAQPRHYYGQSYYRPAYGYGYGYGSGYYPPSFVRGAVLPYPYRSYVVPNYYNYGWAPPPPGYAYYNTYTGQVVLAAIATGLILSAFAYSW